MAWSDVQVTLVGTNGATVSLSAFNPQDHPETARAQVTVILSSGGQETLTTQNFTLPAGGTRGMQLTASSSIASISDGPEPIPPS